MRRSSITGEVRRSVWTICAFLILPVVISLVTMAGYALRYHNVQSRMEQAASLKPIVEQEIPERLFSVAAGRVHFEDSGLKATIADVDDRMDRLLHEGGATGQLEMTVARRTMDTLEQYVLRVRDDMADGRPIAEIEAIVDEVRDVGSLIDDMLENFITANIEDASATSHSVERLVWYSAGVELLFVALALLFTYRTTGRVTRSIRSSISRLENIVRRLTSDDLKARVPEVEAEELQELAVQINLMADRLEEQIAEIRAGQENFAKVELQLLQAQINPHFLYNTLDTIIWQAQSGKGEEVIQLTRALSEFFRISLSLGADWITVRQEAQHLEAYLSIQKIRYRDILNYEMDIPVELQDAYMALYNENTSRREILDEAHY